MFRTNEDKTTSMSHQEFIEECNNCGALKKSESKTYDKVARLCGHIPGFDEKGLSFLVGLLSDKSTAAGELNESGDAPEQKKQWSMQFLSEFNPEGYICIDNPAMLRTFARQISEGKEQYEPDFPNDPDKKKKLSQFPSKEIVDGIIESLRRNSEEISLELIGEGIEDYYDEKDWVLPDNWERVTKNNLGKWYGPTLLD